MIDAISKNRVYVPSLTILNKIDMIDEKQLQEVRKAIGTGTVEISAEKGTNLEELRRKIFQKLNVIRVYTRRYGEKKASEEPMIMKKGSTVRDACMHVHKDLLGKFKFATITGKSVKFSEQVVGLNHIIADGDVLTVVTNR
jgi:ribosome-interacting GTPase 1